MNEIDTVTAFWVSVITVVAGACILGLWFHREKDPKTRNFMLFMLVLPTVLVAYIVSAFAHFTEGSYILFAFNSVLVMGLLYFGLVVFKEELHKRLNPFSNKYREGYKWMWLRDTMGWLDAWKIHVKILGWKSIWKRYAHGGIVPTSGRTQMRRSVNPLEGSTANGGLIPLGISSRSIDEMLNTDMAEVEERVAADMAEVASDDMSNSMLGLHGRYGARNEDLRSFAMRLLRENMEAAIRDTSLFIEIGEWSDDFITSTAQAYLDGLDIEGMAVLHRSLEVRFEENPIMYTQPMNPQELYNQYRREPEVCRNFWLRVLQQGLQSGVPEIWDTLNNEQREQVVRSGVSALDELQWEEFHQRMEYIPGITMPPELRMTEDQWRTLNDLGYQFEVDRDIRYRHDTIIILHLPTDCMRTFNVRHDDTLLISNSVMEELVNFETEQQQSTSEIPVSSFDVNAGTMRHVTDEAGVRINETQVFAHQGNINIASDNVQTQASVLEVPAWMANMDQEALRELIEEGENRIEGLERHKSKASSTKEDMINQLILDKNELDLKIVELKEIIARLLADRSIYKRQVKIRRSKRGNK